MLKVTHTQTPRVVTVDKNAADPKAIDTLIADKTLPEIAKLRQKKYLNNHVEQDHRAIKRLTKAGKEFKSFTTARRTLRGYETMNILRKGQINRIIQGDSVGQTKYYR